MCPQIWARWRSAATLLSETRPASANTGRFYGSERGLIVLTDVRSAWPFNPRVAVDWLDVAPLQFFARDCYFQEGKTRKECAGPPQDTKHGCHKSLY